MLVGVKFCDYFGTCEEYCAGYVDEETEVYEEGEV